MITKAEKTEWLKRLRSNEYAQGKHFLRTQDEQWCCLGILCEIIDPNAWAPGVIEKLAVYIHKGHGIFPFERIVDGWDSLANDLAGLNDEGKTFAEIADIIEEKVETSD